MKRKLASILSIIIFSILFIGCFNYREINKITFATSIIFDRDEYDNVILYIDCVRPYRNANESSDRGRRVIFKGTGKTSLEAIREMNVKSSNRINFSQVRAYIFTEQAARKGVKKYIDLINNDQEFGFKPYMFTYFGDVDTLLDVTSNDEEYLGLYLDQLVEKNRNNAKVISANVNDYITKSLVASNISYMGAFIINEDALDKKIELNGGVIMKDNHMIDRLEQKDVVSYNLLTRRVNDGTLEIPNPDEKDKFVTLDILEDNLNTKVRIDGDKVILEKNINLKVSIGEIQGSLIVDDEALETLKVDEEEKIKIYLNDFFKNYKEKGIDILGVRRLVEEYYPVNSVEDILGSTELKLNIYLVIDGSGLVRDSL